MFNDQTIATIMPALNEEHSLPHVLAAIPSFVDDVLVVDNGSTDETVAAAERGGARVVCHRRRGYGAACLAGIAAAGDADIIVFLDADFSDHAEQMDRLVAPVAEGEADLVIGSRTLGNREPGALSMLQRWGNGLSCFLIRELWGRTYTDLGPFRAVRASALHCLNMDDRTYGWTIQMQIRAIRAGLRVLEVPVDYRQRIGRSKISGTIRGVLGAGSRILATVWRERVHPLRVQWYPARPEHLITLSRYPEPGTTKTRLIPALGAGGAAALHRDMTVQTLLTVQRLQFVRPTSSEIRVTGATAEAMAACFGRYHTYLPQGTGDLGARLNRTVCDGFVRGGQRVVVIGTDCPSLDSATLSAAFDALNSHDLVIGPAADGGYYLIGLRQPCPRLFEGVDWGSSRVLAMTLERAAAANLTVHQLPVRSDLDEPSSLAEWQRHRQPRISVIIPTLNEAELLRASMESASASEGIELIVVDGGSADDTAMIAQTTGARLLRAGPNRALQMNTGAAAAGGSILLFLHADTCLPPGFAEQIERLLANPRAVLAAFRLGIGHPRLAFRLIETAANLRSRLLGLPYADQALAIRAADFYRLGGFRDVPIMEDYDFVRRARREGRIVIARSAVQTSARRWLQVGWLRLTAIHQMCILGFRLGVAPQRLAAWRSSDSAASAD